MCDGDVPVASLSAAHHTMLISKALLSAMKHDKGQSPRTEKHLHRFSNRCSSVSYTLLVAMCPMNGDLPTCFTTGTCPASGIRRPLLGEKWSKKNSFLRPLLALLELHCMSMSTGAADLLWFSTYVRIYIHKEIEDCCIVVQ